MSSMEMCIDEGLLNEFIELTAFGGELQHRGLNAFLRDIAMLGYLYRDKHQIIFMNTNSDPPVDSELDEDYQKYLDKKASGIQKENWDEIKNA